MSLPEKRVYCRMHGQEFKTLQEREIHLAREHLSPRQRIVLNSYVGPRESYEQS